MRNQSCRGMTLVELLVVLAILAIMTTVAVTSSDVFLSQGRYDATIRTLTDIQEAVLGPPNARQSDGTLVSMGFVADVGRWPQFTIGDLPGGQSPVTGLIGGPWELLNQPSGIAPFWSFQRQATRRSWCPVAGAGRMCGWRRTDFNPATAGEMRCTC